MARTYKAYIWRKWLVIAAMAAAVIASIILSLSAGSASLSITDVAAALAGKGSGQISTIVWNVRMPRIATAAVVGMALSLSGCIMQAVLHNPLASSSTLGVSQGASFGAALAICLGSTGAAGMSTSPYLVTASAFCGGMFTTIVILALSKLRSSSPSAIILAGVAISAMFNGATALIQYFADDVVVASIVYWTFGNLGRTGWKDIALIFLVTLPSAVFFCLSSWNYNAISSGSSTAKSLGVNVEIMIPASLVVCALATSVSVAFTGCISFIGLIAPHVMRRSVGNDYRFLIPASGLCGAVLLILSDMACRLVLSPVVLPIGALTSFLGAPLFLYLIVKGRKSYD